MSTAAHIREQWGPQAWIDLGVLEAILVKHGQPLVRYTLLPMIRLAAAEEADEIEARFDAFCAEHNEAVRPWDSPRERYRKRYARFVREIEWTFLELRRHVPERDYERMVVESAAAIMRQTIGGSLSFIQAAVRQRQDDALPSGSSDAAPGGGVADRLGKAVARTIDPSRLTHFLTGDAHVVSADLKAREIALDVPDCAWHRVASPGSLPVLDRLPEQGCLVMCKATCERVFDGSGGLRMTFEPRLPETGCTMRIAW